jgi:biotin transport system substrate-specific component
MTTQSESATLAPLAKSSTITAIGIVLIGSWLLATSSWIEAPMWPVPMTAQTYAVLLIGAICGFRLAAATVTTYLLEGALDLPMFAGGAAGARHLIEPTGGYLFGFLIGAAAIGWLVEHGWGRSFVRLLAAMTIGHTLIFAAGVAYLAVFTGAAGALSAGLYPFVLGSIVKTVAAAATVKAIQGVSPQR